MENLFAYTGREYDQDTEFYGYRNRYYSPSLGRFISMDPIGLRGGDLNLYRYTDSVGKLEVNLYKYASNNPLRFTDPLGLYPDDPAYIPGPAGTQGTDKAAYNRGVAQGAAVAAAVGVAAVGLAPAAATEAALAYGAAKSGGTAALYACLSNPAACSAISSSVASGVAQGVTGADLPPDGAQSPLEFGVDYLSRLVTEGLSCGK